MRKHSPMILFIQEHWIPNHELDTFEKDFPQYSFHSTAYDMFVPEEELLTRSGPTWYGTSIAWKMEIDKYITRLPFCSERFCGVLYSDEGCSFLLSTLYLPTSGQDEDFNETLEILSADILKYLKEGIGLIIGTDTNVSIKSTKRRQAAMKHFQEHFNLHSILPHDLPTFHHHNQTSASQIDHILHNSWNVDITFKEQICQLEHSDNLSSHDVILGMISIPEIKAKTTDTDYTETYKSFKVNKPKWSIEGTEDYQNILNEALVNIFDRFHEPAFIPALSEMCSNVFVISAELAFDTANSNPLKTRKIPKFSARVVSAYTEHERVCKSWRAAGRPSSNSHPAKALKLHSQRNLQRVIREEASNKATKLHLELMECHSNDMSKVCRKIRDIKGNKNKDIKLIETLCGTYEGDNVLKGFCANTEILCNKRDSKENSEFYKMCEDDLEIIIELSKDNDTQISHLTLPEIIFHRLKLNKACDIFKLTVEHLRYAGDTNLNLILRLLNLIIDNLNYLSSPQLNTALTSVVHMGKSKPVHLHKSYRQVRVTPLIARLLDEHLRPSKIKMTKWQQKKSQYELPNGCLTKT